MAQAYTSITAEDFAAFVGYSVEEAVKGTNASTGGEKLMSLSKLFTAAGGLTSCVFLFFFPQRCCEPGLASRPLYQDGDAQEAR